MTVSANGVVLGEVLTSDSGELMFLIDTTGADLGFYMVEASGNESAATQIILQENAPQWAPENEGVVFSLPAGIAAQMIFMPVIIK